MQDIGAWRKSSELAGEGGGPAAQPGLLPCGAWSSAAPAAFESPGPERLTEVFRRAQRLDYAERLEDGFCDVGGHCPEEPRPCGVSPAGCVLVVDRRQDKALTEFLDRAQKKLLRANDAATRVMVAALLVSEALGRSGYHAANMQQRYERLVLERASPRSKSIRLGDILHEQGALGGKGRQPGAGGARPRSLLFKTLADWLSVAPCSLCRDGGGSTWNTVLVEGEAFVVDVMLEPGALYEQGSGKAAEYLRRLQQESQPRAGAVEPPTVQRGGVAAPSVLQGLGGRMLRPSWHVEPWEVEFDRRDRAGRGGFGEVFQGTWAGQPTAVKEVRDASPTDGDVCDFILEISLLSRLSHPNVVRFWRGCVDLRGGHRTLLLLTEWMDRGVLSTLLHESQEPSLTAGQVHVLATGIGRGVAYLHHVKILHLDLKSPNVLLNSSWQPKLCDFGLAKLREQTALHTTLRGVSPIWAPPEMFDDRAGGVTEKADVYSFGIIVLELATRKLPYSDVGQMQLPQVKAKGLLPCFPEDMDAGLAELARLCLSQQPGARPSMQAAILQIQQTAQAQGLELQEEQAAMEQHGLHPLGPAGSAAGAANAEQLRRAEAEKRRAELEVARLQRLLEEEETRLRLLQAEGTAAAGEAGRQRRIEELCAAHTQAVAGAKFRCGVCRKLFRGPEFVHKHVRERHLDALLLSSALAAQGAGEAGSCAAAAAPPIPSDVFFDADVAEESSARLYTGSVSREVPGLGRFSQALQDAAEVGDLSRLQQCLLQGGSAVSQADTDGTTPLQLSAKHGHLECVQYLVSSSGHVDAANEAGFTALHLAAQEGHAEACELLMQASASADSHGSAKARSPLHLAAANGHRDACALLLLHRASVNLQDEDGESALHNAARFGDRELCEVILSWGASVSVADNDGWSPLHEAARWGDGELVESLLRRGADLSMRSNDGESALHVVPGGYAEFEVVEVLLAWGCDVNCKDYDGETPLHVAVKLGDAELAGVLLSNGADANATNTAGATPLDFAKKDEVRWLLRSHRARRGAGA